MNNRGRRKQGGGGASGSKKRDGFSGGRRSSGIDYKGYPNPFDFVPFKEKPSLFSPAELEQSDLLTGYITLKLTAKTPVHIIGNVHADNGCITRSTFYRQDGMPCIPGSSIRGMIRSFIEALTNGWVSQVEKEEYIKKHGERYGGYKVFGDAVPESYRPFANRLLRKGGRADEGDGDNSTTQPEGIDIATYLFGYVLPEKGEEEEVAWRSRVSFEDAYFEEEAIKEYYIPDIKGTAFMGSPNPRKSSWWYFEPEGVSKRSGKSGSFGTTSFEGGKYRGRKFYYHQDPEEAVELYMDDKEKDSESKTWPRHKNDESRSPRYRFPIECLGEDKETEPFRIYFERVPEALVGFFAVCLCPEHSRHSLGYGKPYGYGAVEFSLVEAKFRKVSVGWPGDLEDYKETMDKYISDGFKQFITGSAEKFVDKESLIELETILFWLYPGITFLYPPYVKGYFKQAVGWRDVFLNKDNAWIISELARQKKTVDFRHYQDNVHEYEKLKKRRSEAEKRYNK